MIFSAAIISVFFLTFTYMICSLITYRDNTHAIRYSDAKVEESFFIKQWEYKDITKEKIEEIEKATTEEVEAILSKL